MKTSLPLKGFFIKPWILPLTWITPEQFYRILHNKIEKPNDDPCANIFALIMLCRQFEEKTPH